MLNPIGGLVLATVLLYSAGAQANDLPRAGLAREILAELVAYPTIAGSGTTVAAAERMAERLKEGGFAAADVHVLRPEPDLGVLVARYRGADSAAPAALLMAHMDVVPISDKPWSVPAFELTEKDGYLYGRGSYDNKSGVAIIVANLLRLRLSGFVPQRDLILLVTADEESTQMSIQWMLTEHRALIDAGFALNSDGGRVGERQGRAQAFLLQVAEKVYLNYRLRAHSVGGHSSTPTADNAIYELSAAIGRLAAHQFPENIGEGAAGYLGQFPHTQGAYSEALRHTTCVATQLQAGHAENALPESAEAIVNCRMLPQEDPGDVEAQLRLLIGPDVTLERTWEPLPSPPSPMSHPVVARIRDAAQAVFPGLPVVPALSTGASDGAFTRNAGIPTYGVQAVTIDLDDDRAHGTDERLSAQGFALADQFWFRLLQSL